MTPEPVTPEPATPEPVTPRPLNDANPSASSTSPLTPQPFRLLPPRLLALSLLAVLLAAAAVGVTALLLRRTPSPAATSLRPSGLPGNISTGVAALMGLSPVPASKAPAFALTDQAGRRLTLSSFRGHSIVLEFMDPHCTDICPIVSQEFVDAYHDLGRRGRSVVFVAVNVNRYALQVADVAAFSNQHQLSTIPTWHFFTGPLDALRRVWSDYGIQVQSRGPRADVIHSSVVYFIAPNGTERFLASPIADHTSAGTAYLPAAQLGAWGRGIATIAADLSA